MNLSVTQRLLAVAGLTTMLLMPAAGIWLSQAFRVSVTAAYDTQVAALMEALAARVESSSPARTGLSRTLQDARFEQVYSGWYWQLARDNTVQRTSRSLWDAQLTLPPLQSVRETVEPTGPRGEPLRGLRQRLLLSDGSPGVDVVLVGPVAYIDLEVQAFNRLLVQALGSLALLLLLTFALQIRWGLAPLRGMRDDLAAVRRGLRPRLSEQLPPDLRGLAVSMNQVLHQQEALIERGRVTAGNLAHGLKQPLAALRLQLAAATPDLEGARVTLRRLTPIIEHHLARAAAAGRSGGQFRRIDLMDALNPVVRGVTALNADRRIAVAVASDAGVTAAIDPQDLQEMVGNLLENAARAARQRVLLTVRAQGAVARIDIDDDGAGLSSTDFDAACGRGLRLDERAPGSGLGLAIVREICDLYGWQLSSGVAPLGGLRVTLLEAPPA